MRLHDWQEKCLRKWQANEYRGIVNAATGAGKTFFSIAAIKLLEENGDNRPLKVKIIVPKGFLVRQWFHALKDLLGAKRGDIGIFSGGIKSSPDKKYMIYVINSARYSFARHMRCEAENRVLIIADECHHYGSQENSKIFDFADIMPKYFQHYALGLSATPQCKNINILTKYLGKEIYSFGFADALDAGIISSFSLIYIGLQFSEEERDEYSYFSDKLGVLFLQLKKLRPRLYYSDGESFFIKIDKMIKYDKDPNVRDLAQAVLFLSYRRKELVHFAKARLSCVLDLVSLLDRNMKIIIFGERIEMANEIYEGLNMLFPGKVGLYHSKTHKTAGRLALRKFEDSETRILVSCKTLDEGLNVSDADAGIVVSSTSGERQRIQRLGRVLRKKESGKQAYFYHLYVEDTTEEDTVLNDQSRLWDSVDMGRLYYDSEGGGFVNPVYDIAAERAVKAAADKYRDDKKIEEMSRNITLGAVRRDWLDDEDTCISKIKRSTSKRERNYYVAMLFVIRAMR